MGRLAMVLAFLAVMLLAGLVAVAEEAGTQAAPKTWREITFVAKEKGTEKPVADVEIELGKWGPGRYVIKTGADGVAKTMLPMWAKRQFDAEAHKEGFVPLVYWWHPKGKGGEEVCPESVTFEFEVGAMISGKVVDQEKRALEGASVAIVVRGDRKKTGPRPDLSFVTTQTDKEGKWSFRVPEKIESMEMGAFHPLCLNAYGFYELKKVEDVGALRDGTSVMTLTRGTPIAVKVVGPDGQPVAGAGVGSGGDRVASNALPEFTTDEKGELALGMQGETRATLTVKAKGFAPELQQVMVGSKPLELTFTMKPAVTLTGKVVDGEGKPIAAAWIFVDTWRGARTINANLQTNLEGEFTWKEAPADAVLVDVMKQGYADERRVSMTAGAENKVVLHGPTTVSGTVVDAESGKSVETFTVFQGIGFQGDQISWQRRTDASPEPTAGKGGAFTMSLTYPYPKYALRVEAEGYLPSDSPTFAPDGKAKAFTFKMVKGKPVAGVVKSGEKAVSKAEVFFVGASDGLQMMNGRVPTWNRDRVRVARTDEAGHFAFPSSEEKFVLCVLADEGYAQVNGEEFAKSSEIALLPWAKVEGTVRMRTHVAANQKVQGWAMDQPGAAGQMRIFRQYEAVADDKGHYELDRVFPGVVSVGRFVQLSAQSSTTTSSTKVTAEAGKTVTCDVGGNGRPVVAHLALPPQMAGVSWIPMQASISSKITQPVFPDHWATMSAEERRACHAKWMASPEGKKYDNDLKNQRHIAVVLSTDGTLRAEEVPAGEYTLSVQLAEPPAANACGWGAELGTASQEFTMPAIEGGTSDEALDLGVVVVKAVVNVKVGDVAPAFVVKTLDGKELKLADFRGKYVLVDFWATWCGPCVAEMPHMKAAYEAFGGREDFVMIGLSLDPDVKAPADYVEKNGIGWRQGFLGDWSKAELPNQYGVRSIPSCWLIGPDGKVVAKGLRGEEVKATLGRELPKK